MGSLSSPGGHGGIDGGGKRGDVIVKVSDLTSELSPLGVSFRFFVDCVSTKGDPALFFPVS